MNCPNCGTHNDANNRFCLKCGTALTAAAAPNPAPTSMPPQPPQLYQSPPPYQPAPTPPTYVPPPQPQPPYQPHPPAYQPTQPGYPTYSTGAPYGIPGTGALNIWGPFAGYGTRRRHVGWLMNGEGQHAPELVAKIEAKFKEREIPGTYLSKETLTGRGLMVETRPYFILRRGLASAALYITQFGRDLFISLVSYLKPPISNFRAIVAGVMLLFLGYMIFIYPVSLNSAASSATSSLGLFGSSSRPNASGLIFLLCVVGPLGGLNSLAMFILFCFSAYKWLTEKDFLAALRVPPNEFNEDDLMAMEKAVEETVRQSLTDIKLDPDELKMTTTGRGGQLF